ncbi:hypothetical protein EGM88_04770 [Aureibaculum marinum]|uniref:DUF4292 domain-containing protein n=1 Tax=Aureibaculum marinum TaxID=2487930 RepID=A0A3N4NW85_9FLAO|nr:hypothetical protein [Aureibaculum marinum]RPD98518.1 hypothetical protein EGM88_04770 [Aureibaculum marinum]
MLKNLSIAIALLFLLTSCAFTEEMHINNDGSGTYNFKMDMSEMMLEMQNLGTKDSTAPSKKIDTIFNFKDILEEKKDSIAQLPEKEQMAIKAIANMNLHMQVDDEKGKMLMDFGFNFKDVSEVKNIEEKLSKAMSINKNNSKASLTNKSNVTFEFDGKNFTRKTIPKKLSEEEEINADKQLQQSGSFLDGSVYKLIYHFERKIKNVTHKDAIISKDGKTLILEVPMDSLVKNPQLLDFTLKLK